MREALKDAGFGLVLAVQFLTRLPVPLACPWNARICRWAARCYPLVGMLIGVLAVGIIQLAGAWLPAPLQALLLLSWWVALSGGLHLDGVMDLADALGSNAPPARRWEILKDAKVGAFAVIALVFLLAWKGALIWALIDAGANLWWLVAIIGLGRLGAVALLVEVASARTEGLAHAWQQSLSRRDFWLAALAPLAWLMLIDLPLINLALTVWLLLTLALFLTLYGLAMRRLFGGINGDMLGAAIEGGELWLLLMALSWWQFATG